jgi:selenophosphate synthase
LTENFWDQVSDYRMAGFDPLRWIPTCSNELGGDLLQATLGKVKRCSIKLDPSWFDAFYYSEKKVPELTRRVFDFNEHTVEKEVEIHHALSLFQLYSEIGENQSLFENVLLKFFKRFQSKVLIRKNTVTLTSHQESQFALLDYVKLHKGDKVGYTAANNSATQIIDPTLKMDSEIHSNIAMVKTIDHLNLLGCTSGFKLFPIYDAASEDMLDKIRRNLDAFTSRYNLGMEDYSSLKVGKVFFGNTAIANTLKELPVKYDQVETGMQVIISNKFGALSAFSLFMLTKMDSSIMSKFEQNDINPLELSTAKDLILKNLSEPRFSLGRIISKYCPDFGMNFDKSEHIMAVYPVSSDGIFAVNKLSILTNSEIVINDIPMVYDGIAKFLTTEFLIANSTIPANGCHLIVAPSNISNLIIEDLRKRYYDPSIIGYIANKEKPSVKYNTDVRSYLISNQKLQSEIL